MKNRRSPVSRSLVLFAALSTALLPPAQATNIVYTLTSPTGTSYSAGAFTPAGTPGVGDVLQYSTLTTPNTFNLDVSVTLGSVRTNANTGAFTLGAGGGTLTLDGTGLLAANQGFGNAGVAYLGTTSSGGSLTINAPISLANTNLDIGNLAGVNTGMTIAGAITATTDQTINIRGNGSGGIGISGSIGATGSNIAIANLGAANGTLSSGTAGVTFSGALGPKVTSITQGSATSPLTLSGSLAAFTGSLTLSAGSLTISGAGPASGNALTMSAGTTLLLDNTTNASNDRITGDVVLGNTGAFTLNGNGSTSSVTETVGTLKVMAGSSTVTIGNTGTNRIQTLAAADFARSGNGTALIRGANLGGQTTSNGTRITIGGTGLTSVGTNTSSLGAVTNGTDKQLKIVPYFIGATASNGVGTNFVTYDTNSSSGGLRLLAVGEQSLISGGTTGDNVKTVAGANAVAAGAKVFNSLLIGAGTASATPATTASTVTGAGGVDDTLTLTSGALANVSTGASSNGAISGFSSIIFGTTGANEAIITNTNASSTLTIGSAIDTSASGGGLTKTGAGTVILTAANLYSGRTIINQGTLQIGDGGSTGNLGQGTAGVQVGIGGTLTYNRTGAFTVNSVSGGGTVNNNSASTTLTLNQVGDGLALKGLGGVSGGTLEFGGDGTGVTSIGSLANANTPTYMQTAGQLYKFTNGTVNLLDSSRGFLSNIEVAGGTLNLVNNNLSMTGVNGGTQTFTISSGRLNLLASFGLSGLNGNGGAAAAGTANSTFVGTQTGGTIAITSTGGRFDLGSTSGGNVSTYNFSGGLISLTGGVSAPNGFRLGADTAGTSSTTFNFSGGKLVVGNTGISGSQGTSARQAFVWTGGTLATVAYDATNLTSTADAAYSGNVGTLTNKGGILAPGDTGVTGRTSITGKYSVTSADAVLAIDIGGTGASSVFQDAAAAGKFDWVSVSSTAALGGKLSVGFIDNFGATVTNANTFRILTTTTAGRSGTFTNTAAANGGGVRVALADGLASFKVNYNANDVTLGSYLADNGWSGASGASWSAGNSWSAFAPSLAGHIAKFGDAPAAGAVAVNLDADETVAGLQFDSTTRNYTIDTASHGLTLDNNGSASTVSAVGTHSVNVPLVLNNNLNVTTAGAGDSLSLGGAISGSVRSLTKTGDGLLALSGANTYGGGTTISAGTLLVNNTAGSGTGTGLLTIASGATLGGSGIIDSVTTIAGSLSPGNSPGVLVFNQAVTLETGSAVTIEINGASARGVDYDGLDFNGALTISGGTLTFNIGSAISDASVLNIFDGAVLTGTFTGVVAAGAGDYNGAFTLDAGNSSYSAVFGAQTVTLDLASGELSFVGSAIPEPSTYAILTAVATLGFAVLRRRSRRA